MGNSYYVPRSVRGESRILYIFTIKSFIATLGFGLIGVAIWFLLSFLGIPIGTITGLIVAVVFAALGYGLSTIIIPDVPAMGVLRKAGGENIGAMLIRLLTFRGKKKIYLYNYKREIQKGGETNGK